MFYDHFIDFGVEGLRMILDTFYFEDLAYAVVVVHISIPVPLSCTKS
jgi:hypothetical protein